MTQEQLAHTLFPLGNLRKTEVRAIAAENGFINAQKPDSQDICFVPDGDYAGVIEKISIKSTRPVILWIIRAMCSGNIRESYITQSGSAKDWGFLRLSRFMSAIYALKAEPLFSEKG